MPLTNSDLVWYKSLIGNSEGGGISAVPIVTALDNNLWADLNAAELLAGGTRYRKIYIANISGTDSWLKPVVWITLQPTNMVETIGLGIDSSDDDDAAGGSLTQWTANAILQAVSDGADTRTLTIYGLNAVAAPISEAIVLNGTTPVSSTTTWSVIYGVFASALSGARVVTVKQGAGGTTRGTFPINFLALWAWIDANDKASGIRYVDVGAGTNIAVWRKQVWAPATSGVRPNDNRVKAQEA